MHTFYFVVPLVCAYLRSALVPVVVSDILHTPPPPASSGGRLLAIPCIKLFITVVVSCYCFTLGRGRIGAGDPFAHFLSMSHLGGGGGGSLSYDAQDGVGSPTCIV